MHPWLDMHVFRISADHFMTSTIPVALQVWETGEIFLVVLKTFLSVDRFTLQIRSGPQRPMQRRKRVSCRIGLT